VFCGYEFESMVVWSWRGLNEDCSAGGAEGSFWVREGRSIGGADGDEGTRTVQALNMRYFGYMLMLSKR
jgi:hypothetical protein